MRRYRIESIKGLLKENIKEEKDLFSRKMNKLKDEIVMMTAKIEEEERISGLSIGADDYVS